MNLVRIIPAIGVVGAALILCVHGPRESGAPVRPKATLKRAERAPDPPAIGSAREEPPSGLPEEPVSYIGGGTHRAELLDQTAKSLGFEGSRAEAFKVQARQVVAEIDWAWSARDAAVIRPDVDEAREREIQEEYEARKRLALARLETAAGEGALADEFRSRLEEWIDAVR